MKVILVDLLVPAVPVEAVVEDTQPGVIMDLVAMDQVVVVDPAIVMQLITTITEIVMQMHILMVEAVSMGMAQMAEVEAAVALDLVLVMPTRNSLHHDNPNMEPHPLSVEWVPYNLFSFVYLS
jgi:hypothetical protein